MPTPFEKQFDRYNELVDSLLIRCQGEALEDVFSWDAMRLIGEHRRMVLCLHRATAVEKGEGDNGISI